MILKMSHSITLFCMFSFCCIILCCLRSTCPPLPQPSPQLPPVFGSVACLITLINSSRRRHHLWSTLSTIVMYVACWQSDSTIAFMQAPTAGSLLWNKFGARSGEHTVQDLWYHESKFTHHTFICPAITRWSYIRVSSCVCVCVCHKSRREITSVYVFRLSGRPLFSLAARKQESNTVA